MMDQFINPVCFTRSAASLSAAMGIEPPFEADPALPWLVDLLMQQMGGSAEKTLFFHPDAIAQWLWRKYPEYFVPVLRHTPMPVPFSAVLPSVTPVCFASIYSGASPEKHGIREYRKPILTIDTLFDRILASGRRCANVASAGCSMAAIFADRKFDAYITEDDGDTYRTVLRLLEEDRYDHISVYFGEYDSLMHKHGTENDISLAKLQEHFQHFDHIASYARKAFAGKRHLITVQTDHGVHDLTDGRGAHGSNETDDMNVVHFFGAYRS